MSIGQTIGRLLLGMAFGFIVGIVVYQVVGVDGGLIGAQVNPPAICGKNSSNICAGDCAPGFTCGAGDGSGLQCICIRNPPPPSCGGTSDAACGGSCEKEGEICTKMFATEPDNPGGCGCKPKPTLCCNYNANPPSCQ